MSKMKELFTHIDEDSKITADRVVKTFDPKHHGEMMFAMMEALTLAENLCFAVRWLSDDRADGPSLEEQAIKQARDLIRDGYWKPTMKSEHRLGGDATADLVHANGPDGHN